LFAKSKKFFAKKRKRKFWFNASVKFVGQKLIKYYHGTMITLLW
jgi:hypothetical protein